MKKNKDSHSNSEQGVNLKLFLQKVLQYKWLVILSISLCLGIAIAYIKLATPIYEASTSILIDASGSSRALGDSQYVHGGVNLIETEKNLYNEIGIIKSFSLIRKTVEDLNFNVSYYAGNFLKMQEYYGYFPFEVQITENSPQLYGVPFEVKLLPNDQYNLKIESNDFKVSNPLNGSKRRIERGFSFSGKFSFDEKVVHDYFTFSLRKSDYKVSHEDLSESELSFVVNDLDDIANDYSSDLRVDNIDIQASIFKITSVGALIDRQVDFLSQLTTNYVSSRLSTRNKIASTKEGFIRNQLQAVSDSLNKVELKLEQFKKDKKALNLGATASNALGSTSNLQTEKGIIELKIEYYNSLIDKIKSSKGEDEFILPSVVGIEDPLINASIIELKDLYAEKSRKKFFVTSNNAEMSILNNQINESTQSLIGNLQEAIRASEFSLQRVNSQLSNFNGVISSLPTRENELLTIERQSTLYENLFNYLSQELAKTGIAAAESTSDTRILDEARMSGDRPISPQKELILILAFTIGILIPLVWIVLFSPKDVIVNVEQIMANSDIPVIASIIHDDTKTKKSNSDVSLWILKEAFRDLSTNLRFVSTEPCVLGITSIMPDEGKTYNAINLGITFAETGKKTLIIDTDLRNPSLVKRVSKNEGKGLADYLQGDVKAIKDIIYPHEKVNNLKIIPTSVAEGNIHELFSGNKMNSLITELKQKFDYIILDTPAVGLVSDFMLISDKVDVNLFIVRRNIAKLKFLKDLQGLSSKGDKKSFIIFNDVLRKDHKYGYEEKYGRNKEKQLVADTLSI